MTAWNHWTEEIAKQLSKQLKTTIAASEIIVPPDPTLGDFAFGCFRLASHPLQLPLGQGEGKRSPAVIAQQIAKEFKKDGSDIAHVQAAGPYVNFTLAIDKAVSRVIQDIGLTGERYGRCDVGQMRQVLFEYVGNNTHKEIHIGHLRNVALGVSLIRLLKFVGWDVVAMSYHGDVGAHVAKCLWQLAVSFGLKAFSLTIEAVDELLKKLPESDRTGEYLGRVYAEATRALAEDEDLKDQISLVQQKLEAHDPAWEKLWKETRQWSLDEMKVVFYELDVTVDRQYLESEVYKRGLEIADELMKKGIAKISEGAVVVDLEEKKLGIFLIKKSDGTSLYATKDLALAELKAQEYPSYTRSLHLVDSRQAFYFRQLFETLHRMGFDKPLEYIGYEIVTLKEGTMSSRKGNIVTYETFRDAVLDYARQEILVRHADWPEEKIEHVVWDIAMAGIKFGMLKQDSDKIYTFELEQALSFDGATGPYCQYAATRLGSILKKANQSLDIRHQTFVGLEFDHETEKQLALKLARFPIIVQEAADKLKPSLVAQWCLETAQVINAFYRDVPVLDSNVEQREARLRLVVAARQTLVKGLNLLGIPVPEEM